MSLTLETSLQPDGLIAWVAGDPGKRAVGRISSASRSGNGTFMAEAYLAEAYGIGREAKFVSLAAAEYWLLAMVIEHHEMEARKSPGAAAG